MHTRAPEVTCEGQGLLNHSSVNGISFSPHELLTCIKFCQAGILKCYISHFFCEKSIVKMKLLCSLKPNNKLHSFQLVHAAWSWRRYINMMDNDLLGNGT